jgi:hypothetical protein
MNKICSKCKEEKSFDNFSKSSSRKDGLNPYCKQCISQNNLLNKEKRAATNRVYYDANKDKISEKAKEHYLDNREVIIARTKQYADANREKCKEQSKLYYKENNDNWVNYRDNNKERIKENKRIRRETKLEHDLAVAAEYRKHNQDILASKAREHYVINADKCRKRLSDYRKNNPEKFLALVNKRRATKLNATPEWLTSADFAEIEELYLCARMFKLYTGEDYHVDHIVPLQGKNVCGLHVPWNLQVIPAKENLSKSNKI